MHGETVKQSQLVLRMHF